MEIKNTNDYSLFKSILANREIDEKHVTKLAKSITRKNLLYIRPLIVNEKMQVIDGQHRLAAAKQIKATVYYIKVEGLTKADISVINTAQKNWTRSDFINFYAMDGNVHYKQLAAFIDKYYWLAVSTVVGIAAKEDSRLATLKEGGLKLRDVKVSEAAFQRLRQIEPVFPWIARDRVAASSLAKMLDTDAKVKKFLANANDKNFRHVATRAESNELINSILNA